jgi:hypothetical protein
MFRLKCMLPACFALFVFGCGGESDSAFLRAACGEEPCGGDLVGVWNVGPQCGESNENEADRDEEENAECPDATYSVNSYFSGGYTFNADGTYRLESTLQITARSSTPASCIPMGSVCLDLGENEGDCAQASASAPCVCNFSRTEMDTEQGSYEVVGNTVTFIGDDGESGKLEDFCVDGNVLSLGDEQVFSR